MRAFPPAFALLVASALSLHGQGPLTPPGPPAPTMKTLDQVEARTPVNAATTPGSAQTEFIINQPGSYYLTGNVVTSKTNGIQITAAGVTLDLNGFEIRRTTVGGESGIVINASRCTVKNGSVTRFFYGILGLSETGGGSAKGGMLLNISASQNTHGLLVGESWRIDGCVATGNTGRGIRAGFSALVRNCVVTDSGSSGAGIDVGEGSKVINCNVSGNAGRGIDASNEVTVESCTAIENGGDGIRLGNKCVVRSSTANRNGGQSGIIGTGINAGIRALITGCTADENRADGISAQGDSVVVNNRASLNGRGGASASAAGIRLTGAGSRIEANHARDNDGVGIQGTLSDVIIRNTAGNNSSANFLPAAGVNMAPIQQPNNATNPFANVVF